MIPSSTARPLKEARRCLLALAYVDIAYVKGYVLLVGTKREHLHGLLYAQKHPHSSAWRAHTQCHHANLRAVRTARVWLPAPVHHARTSAIVCELAIVKVGQKSSMRHTRDAHHGLRLGANGALLHRAHRAA